MMIPNFKSHFLDPI